MIARRTRGSGTWTTQFRSAQTVCTGHPDAELGGAGAPGVQFPVTCRGRSMKNVANSRFTIKSWDEKPYSEGQGLPRLTRAAVSKTFAGDIEGEGHVEYLM